jgi:hypothetical protein
VSSLPNFTPVKSDDRVITQIQQSITDALGSLLNIPILAGEYVTVTFGKANTDLLVTHGLGNANNVTWLLGQMSATGSITLSPNNGNASLNPKPAQQVILRSNMAGLTAGLWFFNS